MPVFTVAGDGMYDFWLLDGQPDFATIPSGVFDGLERDMPIRLQNGDQRFGMTHIRQRAQPLGAEARAHWLCCYVASQKTKPVR